MPPLPLLPQTAPEGDGGARSRPVREDPNGSRQRVKSSVSVFCWARTLGQLHPRWVQRQGQQKEEHMALSDDTHRRRRRRGFWTKVRNPRTVKAVISAAFVIYRAIRWLMEFFGPPG